MTHTTDARPAKLDRTGTRTRTLVTISLWSAAVLSPAPNFLAFDGLPMTGGGERLVIGLLVFGVAAARVRRRWWEWLTHAARCSLVIGLVVPGVVMGVKALLLRTTDDVGFPACYRSVDAPLPGGACERSYDNPLFRGNVTRHDRTIAFGPVRGLNALATEARQTTWNLGFLNDVRFSYVTGELGTPSRQRVPFEAVWRAPVHTASGRIAVRYVGEGDVTIDGERTNLPASYGGERSVDVPVTKGPHEFALRFAFDDGFRQGDPPPGPYAYVRVETEGEGDAALLTAVGGPAGTSRLLGFLLDAVVLAAAGAVGLATILALAERWRVATGIAGAIVASYFLEVGVGAGLAPSPGPFHLPVIALGGAFVVLLWRRPADLAFLGGAAAIGVGVVRAVGLDFPWAADWDFDAVHYRSGGDDWLVYESAGRSILPTGSPRAGEDVFSFAPGYRYVSFLAHLLLGDGDVMITVASITLLLSSVFVSAWLVFGHDRSAVRGRAPVLVGAAGASLIVVLASDRVMIHVFEGMGEVPTWALVMVAVPLLMVCRTRGPWTWGAMALGATVGLRPNQLVPALLLLGIFVVYRWRRAERRAVVAVAPFAVIAMLPLLHNLVYGGRWVPFTADAGGHVALTPWDILTLRFAFDGETGRLLRDQVAGLLYLSPDHEWFPDLAMGILALQVLWVIAVFRQWSSPSRWISWAVLAWPALALGAAAMLTVFIYYPRHIVLVYVIVTASLFVSERWRADAAIAASPSPARPEASVVGGGRSGC